MEGNKNNKYLKGKNREKDKNNIIIKSFPSFKTRLEYNQKDSNEDKKNMTRKSKIKDIKSINNRLLFLLFSYIALNFVISIASFKDIQRIISSKDSYITLKIKTTGNVYIYYHGGCSKYAPMPDEIYINEIKKDVTQYSYNFNTAENTIKLIWKENINTTDCMFKDCSKITEIKLSNFDTSKIISMNSTFYGCSSLSSLDILHFDTSKVTNMGYLFYNCYKLSSLDISHFDTSKVTSMNSMFKFCSSLSSLNLSNFNTSEVTNMGYMFYDCSSLSSLNLSNFNTSEVTNMGYMFYFCSSLISLNLSNFDTSKVTNMGSIFSGCKKLVSLTL